MCKVLQLDSYITVPAASQGTHTIEISSARILLPLRVRWIICGVLYLPNTRLISDCNEIQSALAKFRCSVTWQVACHCRDDPRNQWSVALSALCLSHLRLSALCWWLDIESHARIERNVCCIWWNLWRLNELNESAVFAANRVMTRKRDTFFF